MDIARFEKTKINKVNSAEETIKILDRISSKWIDIVTDSINQISDKVLDDFIDQCIAANPNSKEFRIYQYFIEPRIKDTHVILTYYKEDADIFSFGNNSMSLTEEEAEILRNNPDAVKAAGYSTYCTLIEMDDRKRHKLFYNMITPVIENRFKRYGVKITAYDITYSQLLIYIKNPLYKSKLDIVTENIKKAFEK